MDCPYHAATVQTRTFFVRCDCGPRSPLVIKHNDNRKVSSIFQLNKQIDSPGSSSVYNIMVSSLSARLLAHSGNSSSSSSSSSKGNSAKRSFSCQSQLRPDFSASGYSADREDPSVSPPLNSIDLLGNSRGNNSDGNKRRKRNELEFAATSVKADLARAGVDFRKIEKDREETSCLGNVKINLKGVRLMFSSELDTPIVSSNVSARSTTLDYEALALSCWDSYPNLSNRRKATKNFTPSHQESDRSTSSFSDTESESVESSENGTNVSKNGRRTDKVVTSASTNALFIPPNIDDHLTAQKQAKRVSIMQGRPCNIIVSPSNSVTLSQCLQLSKTAR
jgi:hypothetical protein